MSQHFLPSFPSVLNFSVILLKWPAFSGSFLWFPVATSFNLFFLSHLLPTCCSALGCRVSLPGGHVYTRHNRCLSGHSDSPRHSPKYGRATTSFLQLLQLSSVKVLKAPLHSFSRGKVYTLARVWQTRVHKEKNWIQGHELVRNIYTYRRKIHKWSSHIPWKEKARRRCNDDGCQNLSQKERKHT